MLEPLNETISTQDFHEVLNRFPKFWSKGSRGEARNQKGQWKDLCQIKLKEVLTQYGLCYSFNLRNLSEWLVFDKVSKQLQHEDFQMVEGATAVGKRSASCSDLIYPLQTPNQEIGLSMEIQKYRSASEMLQFKNPFETIDGFHLIFHHPEELPTANSIHHYTVTNHSLIFWITPQITITDKILMEETPAERNCYSRYERNLNFFKFYNQANCEQECQANHTLAKCGCVQFFMIRKLISRP